jgi:hypothetical protein
MLNVLRTSAARVVLMGTLFIGAIAGADDREYAGVLASVRDAFDRGTIAETRTKLAKGAETSMTDSFGLAVLDFFYLKLKLYGVSLPTVNVEAPNEIRKRLKDCMAKDTESAYPIAAYAWFIALYREPGMATPKAQVIGTSEVKTADGGVVTVPIKRVVADSELERRIADLVQKARKIEYANPLAAYLSAMPEPDFATKALIIKKYIGGVGEYLWEADAIAHLQRYGKDDQALHAGLESRLESLRQKIGSGSPRLRAHGF